MVSQASARFQGAQRMTLLQGPPVAGALIGVIGAPAVLAVDAATYVVPVALVGLFVPATKPVEQGGGSGLRAGLCWVSKEPLIRAWRLSLIVGDIAWHAIFIAFPVLVIARYDGDPKSSAPARCWTRSASRRSSPAARRYRRS